MKEKIGIIGFGYVGQAIFNAFKFVSDIKIYDKFKEGFSTLDEVIDHSDIIFCCLPTPHLIYKNKQDTSDISESLRYIYEKTQSQKIVVIKSTVLPGTCCALDSLFGSKLVILHSPEFLTARTANIDFITQHRILIGHKNDSYSLTFVTKVTDLFIKRFGCSSLQFIIKHWTYTELCKYAINCFFAIKITYANVLFDICQYLGINYDSLKEIILGDGRIAQQHMDVLNGAIDGEGRGFGGACFPKDTRSFLAYLMSENTENKKEILNIFSSVIKYNEKVREMI